MYNKSMKKLTLYILIVLLITCGCSKSNLNSDETFSQPNNQEITNQQISLNKEEPQEKGQKEELEENLHPIDKAERDCIAKNMTTAGMSNCSYIAMDEWFKEIDKYINLLKDVTSKDEYNNILEAQTQWKKYQEAEFKAVSILINKQGTIYQNFLAGKECELVKQRAQDLKSFYDDLIEE